MASTQKRVKLITPIGRFSFPNCFQPAPPMKGQPVNPNAKPKFGTTMIWTPATFTDDDKTRWRKMLELIDALSMEHFKCRMKDAPQNIKRPIRDGVEKKHLGGFGPGTYFANITSHIKPSVVAADNVTEILDPQDLYAGCYGRCSITAYYYNNVSQGIALGLSNVKKIKDGERLDSRTDAATDFADLGEADVEYEGMGGETTGDDFL